MSALTLCPAAVNGVPFSVLCPTYNRSVHILPTLRSVLAQTVDDWELLVLSDGSNDDTVAVASALAKTEPRIQVYPLNRCGHPSGPRNEGLRRARGDYIAYLDHDDIWRPDHLAWRRTLFAAGADLAAMGYEAVDHSGTVTRRSGWWDLCWHPELQTLDPLFEPSRVAHRVAYPSRWEAGPSPRGWKTGTCGSAWRRRDTGCVPARPGRSRSSKAPVPAGTVSPPDTPQRCWSSRARGWRRGSGTPCAGRRSSGPWRRQGATTTATGSPGSPPARCW